MTRPVLPLGIDCKSAVYLEGVHQAACDVYETVADTAYVLWIFRVVVALGAEVIVGDICAVIDVVAPRTFGPHEEWAAQVDEKYQ
jgi:hypothetical protein